jgi:hypothetical protein
LPAGLSRHLGVVVVLWIARGKAGKLESDVVGVKLQVEVVRVQCGIELRVMMIVMMIVMMRIMMLRASCGGKSRSEGEPRVGDDQGGVLVRGQGWVQELVDVRSAPVR